MVLTGGEVLTYFESQNKVNDFELLFLRAIETEFPLNVCGIFLVRDIS